jgi:hypothetical protein
MKLDLVAHWLMTSIAQEIRSKPKVEVRDTEALSQTLINQLLQLGPQDMKWHLLLSKEPSRPMNQVAVNIVELQRFQLIS